MRWDEATWTRDDESWQDPTETLRVHQWLLGRTESWTPPPASETVTTHRKSLAAIDASPTERARFIAAVSGLAATNNVDRNRWGRFPDIHEAVLLDIHGTFTAGDPLRSWPGLGTTPVTPPPRNHRMWTPLMQFLPWHRMFVRWFEQQLQIIVPGVSIPYWDWTTQRRLPSWIDSLRPTIVTPSGRIIDNVDRTPAAKSASQAPPSGGPHDFGSLPSDRDIQGATDITSYEDMTGELEMQHNRPHVWAGGRFALGDLNKSPADIVFFLHHANIDRIWSGWQASRAAAAAAIANRVAASGSVVPLLGPPVAGLGGLAAAAWIRSQAAHPQPSMVLALPSGMSAPTVAGRVLSTAGSVESTTDLEYDYI